jgi:hypothetical protein
MPLHAEFGAVGGDSAWRLSSNVGAAGRERSKLRDGHGG